MKRPIFFLSEKLQITAAERRSILFLGSLLLAIMSLNQFIGSSSAVAIDTGVNADLLAEFPAGGAIDSDKLLQYYPQVNPADLEAATREISSNPDVRETITAPVSVNQSTATITEKININTAGEEQLVTLPGIGPAIAARIIEHRKQHGPFRKIEDLKMVRGIAEARFEAVKDLITVAD